MAGTGTMTVRLYAVDLGTGFPTGGALASTTLAWVGGVNTYQSADLGAIATTTLNANAGYALVAIWVSGADLRWYTTPPAYTFSDGFADVGSGEELVTVNSGGSWTTESHRLVTRLKVAPPLAPATTAAVPSLHDGALWVLALGVMGVGVFRLRRVAV